MAEAALIAVVTLPLQEMPAKPGFKSHVCADRYVMGELCSFLNVVTILNMHE